jgi:hypothetical protein
VSSNGELRLVGRVRAELDALLAVDVAGLPDASVRSDLLELFVAANQVHAAIALRIASFDARGLADADACRTAAAWVRAYGRFSGSAASGLVRQGRVLADLPAVAEAAGRGEVSAEHVGKIGALVKQVGVDAVQPADEILAGAAAKVDPDELRMVCDRIRDYVAPDGSEPLELFEKRELTFSDVGGMTAVRGQLDPEGAAAVREAIDALMKPPGPDDCRTTGQRRADALVDLARGALAHGDLPTVGGMQPQVGILLTPQTLLYDEDPPARTYTRFGDEPDPPDITHLFDDGAGVGDGVEGDGGEGDRGEGDGGEGDRGEGDGGEGDRGDGDRGDGDDGRAADDAARAGAADLDGEGLAEAATRGDPPGSPRVDPSGRARGDPNGSARGDPAANTRGDPLAGLGLPPPVERAWLNWYGPIPPALAKRIACDADIWRIVLDPRTGLPLDVGRAHRLVPYWIRRALYARDRRCRWPGCRIPAPWTDAHHVVPWYISQQTKVEELILLCRYHHTTVHEGRWRIHLDPATGQVGVTRPDGTPHDIAPSRPWTSPTTGRGDVPDTS